MSTVDIGDDRELKDLINTRFSELDRTLDEKIDSLEKKIDVTIAKTDEQLSRRIKTTR